MPLGHFQHRKTPNFDWKHPRLNVKPLQNTATKTKPIKTTIYLI